MVAALVLRGLLAGLAAGVLTAAFGFVLGEPLIDSAISFEERGSTPHAIAHEEVAPVSREGQRAGLFVAGGLYGLSFGALFALTFAALRGRTRAESDWSLALMLGGLGFVAVGLVPFLKYPANPPGIGDPATITERTLLYYTMVGMSLLAVLAAWRFAARLQSESPWRPVVACASFIAIAGLGAALLPGVDEIPPDFPADLLWEFRITALGMQAVLWSAMGVLFAVAVRQRQTKARA
jgi:predicted cobalt transporter CbtA